MNVTAKVTADYVGTAFPVHPSWRKPSFWRGFLLRLCPTCGAPWHHVGGYLCGGHQ